jgi:uncharacterized membrane protein YphA (DoxX/SURF4 family)
LSVTAIAIWLVVGAFLGAGILNCIGTQKTKSEFAKWGYPPAWNLVTGGLEITAAALVAYPPGRLFGLALAAIIMIAAAVALLRHRQYPDLVPVCIFISP